MKWKHNQIILEETEKIVKDLQLYKGFKPSFVDFF